MVVVFSLGKISVKASPLTGATVPYSQVLA
jgi:hypothetical protein